MLILVIGFSLMAHATVPSEGDEPKKVKAKTIKVDSMCGDSIVIAVDDTLVFEDWESPELTKLKDGITYSVAKSKGRGEANAPNSDGQINGRASCSSEEECTRVEIYPNPSSQYFIVRSNITPQKLVLMSTTGEIVTSEMQTDRLLISDLPSQNYILLVEIEGVITKHRLVKL